MNSVTYDTILGAMKSAFFEKTGRDVDALGDLSVRFECVASELFSLWCRSEYVLRQAFPQLSSGEYLDFHAELFGLERKRSAKACGGLTFYLDVISESDVAIPAGTLCAVGDRPYIQYATSEAGLIPAGELSCTVSAQACEAGSRYNANEGEICVMVNPPLYVSGVTNELAFHGGCDDESDSALRDRLKEACAVIPTGYSAESVRQLILRHNEVLDCRVFSGSGVITVMVRTKNGAVSGSLTAHIHSSAKLAELLDMELNIMAMSPEDITLDIDAKCTVSDLSALGDEIEAAARRFINEVKIGEGLNLQKLACVISGLDGVEYADVTSPDADGGIVYAGYACYLSPSEIGVVCHT